MPCHVVGEVGHYNRAPSSLLDRATINLQVVEVPVNVHLTVLVLDDACTRQNLAIFLREVEESRQFVNVGTLHKIGWAKRHIEPLGHGQLLVAIDAIVRFFVDCHVHTERGRVEVEHHELLSEAEPTQGPMDHILNVVVQGLLDVEGGRVDQCGMLPNLGKCHDSFLKLEVSPPLLDAIGSPSLDDHVDRVLFEGAAEVGSPDVLLNHCQFGSTVQQGLKEAQELLVLIRVNRTIVVQDGEENRQDKLHARSLKDKEVIVLVEEDHLVEECFLFPVRQLSLQIGLL